MSYSDYKIFRFQTLNQLDIITVQLEYFDSDACFQILSYTVPFYFFMELQLVAVALMQHIFNVMQATHVRFAMLSFYVYQGLYS